MTPTDATTRDTNKATLRRAMAGITALDAEAIINELDETARFELPFEVAVPDCDRDGFLQLLSMMFVTFKQFEITIVEILDLLDPNALVARYHGDCVGRDKPVSYKNEYIGVFRFRDGKITYWREYNNPEIAHAAIAQFAEDVSAHA